MDLSFRNVHIIYLQSIYVSTMALTPAATVLFLYLQIHNGFLQHQQLVHVMFVHTYNVFIISMQIYKSETDI